MGRSGERIAAAVAVMAVLALVALEFAPLMHVFFDPQDFKSFLCPLRGGMSLSTYMVESWSWFEDGRRIGFFRPVTSLAFMADYPLWGDDPAGYRLDNVLIHLACCLVVARLARAAGAGAAGAPLAALLFAAHPGTQNAVTMIVGRHDLLATLFGLLAVDAAMRAVAGTGRPRLPALAAPALFTALALGSKELGMAALAAVPLVWLAWPGPGRASVRLWPLPVLTLLAGAAYFAARVAVFGDIGGYASITPLREMPRHALTILMQASGAAYFENPSAGYAWLVLAAAVLFGFVRGGGWLKAAVLGCVALLFGFQAVAGTPCAHYVYAPAAVTCAVLGLSAGSGRGPRRALLPVLFLLLTVPAWYREFREEGIAHAALARPFEAVYRGLSITAGTLDPGVAYAIPMRPGDSPEELEMKNAPLYISFLRPGDDIRIRIAPDGILEPGERALVWAGAGVEVR